MVPVFNPLHTLLPSSSVSIAVKVINEISFFTTSASSLSDLTTTEATPAFAIASPVPTLAASAVVPATRMSGLDVAVTDLS